jgi:hypothetical protein
MKTFVRILLITVCIILWPYAGGRYMLMKDSGAGNAILKTQGPASLTAIPAAGIFAANVERVHMIAPEAHLRS